MNNMNKIFALVHKDGYELYPHKKTQRETGKHGFALSAPGKQDRHRQAIYSENIEEVIKYVICDGYGVRAKMADGGNSNTYKLKGYSIKGYRISTNFEHIVKLAEQKPISWINSEINKMLQIETQINLTKKVISESTCIDEIIWQQIKTRRGQSEFRKNLLLAYDGKCCITTCHVESVLEAAHIITHSEGSNYLISNGLLLRADIHTLYDLNLIGIDGKGKVNISESLLESEYWQFHGKIINNIPLEMSTNLAKRFELFKSPHLD